jgi:hypothetical protein
MDPTDIYRTLLLTAAGSTFFSSAHGTFIPPYAGPQDKC